MHSLRSFRIVSPPRLLPYVVELLRYEGFESEVEPFSPLCRRLLREAFPLGASLAAKFGYIYIQDRASMLPPLALGISSGDTILDMAASPGSKTGFLAQLAGPGGFVLANEPTRARLSTLRANLQRLNLIQTGTSCHDGARLPLFSHSFTHILLDPPCSGWGTADKHPQTLKIWQGDNISSLVALQQRLLTTAARLLAPGGKLLYSTCTTNEEENEAQTAFAVEKLGLEPLKLEAFPGFAFHESPLHGLTIDGAKSASQGFYLSLLTTTNGVEETGSSFHPDHIVDAADLASPVFDPDLLPPGVVAIFGDSVRFVPSASFALPEKFAWQAFPLGTMRRGRFIPCAGLRSVLPPPEKNGRQIVFEKTDDIRKLLSGSHMATSLENGPAGLWWRNLPLAIVQVKNGRIIAPAL